MSAFSGRFTVVGKSPASGGWGDANSGGYFAPALKRCGVDAVFFHGASKKPVYLYLDENEARLEDAGEVWGQDAIEAEAALKKKHGKRAQVAVIGQAGENKSFMAGICTDSGRIAARAGLGGVMGSKKLKAVVAAGGKKVAVFDKNAMKTLTKDYRKRLDSLRFMEKYLGDKLLGATGKLTAALPVYLRQPAFLWRALLRKFGTPALTAMGAESGDSPVKNWAGSGPDDFPLSRSQKIGAEAVLAFQKKKYGCFACPLQCGGIMKVDKGPYPLKETHKPEYESICSFGTLILNDDLYSIFKLNDMCNRAGIDTISCGGTMAFAVECFENGIISEDDTDGLKLTWGNSEALIKLAQMIIDREGIGDWLADGVKKAAKKFGKGAEKYAVHCGGIEAPMHDPKLDPGYGISYGLDASPGRHTITCLMYLDIQELHKQYPAHKAPPPFTSHKNKHTYGNYNEKAEMLAQGTYFKHIVDAAGICIFGTQAGGEMPLVPWLNAATGLNMTASDYLLAGERIAQLRHAFNLRDGINARKNFKLHDRVIGAPPLSRGPNKKITLDMDTLGRAWYLANGWNWETGMPNPDRLKRLDMEDVAKALDK